MTLMMMMMGAVGAAYLLALVAVLQLSHSPAQHTGAKFDNNKRSGSGGGGGEGATAAVSSSSRRELAFGGGVAAAAEAAAALLSSDTAANLCPPAAFPRATGAMAGRLVTGRMWALR